MPADVSSLLAHRFSHPFTQPPHLRQTNPAEDEEAAQGGYHVYSVSQAGKNFVLTPTRKGVSSVRTLTASLQLHSRRYAFCGSSKARFTTQRYCGCPWN